MKTPKSIGALIRNDPNSLHQRLDIARQLDKSWQNALGAQWAARSYPRRIERSTLFVGVYEPIWIQEFEMMSKEILGRLKNEMPQLNVKQLRFEYSERPAKPQPAQRGTWKSQTNQ